MTGSMTRVKSRDGFEFDAWHVQPQGPRKGGVIVIQEIFGLSDHIKEMAERLGAAGYEAIAPSMYDRAERGFIVQPKDVAAGMTRGRELAMGNGQDNALNDIGGVFDVLSKSGKVSITGYCYGGTMSWLAAARLEGLSAASCYYGGNIPQMIGLTPKCPTICHFGAKDAHIPLVGAVDKIQAAHPDIPVYIYDAGHGFARKESTDYDAASDKLAFDRTLELFGKAS
ncbi:MAG TPA: dienelactone hydrolase family protein [Hyphomonadaceae bacterium]|nr:dienelactone hydrolase family protein [Hyphomonadaceae bacterium]HPI48925.1 dienelactone hydrolase family protein [Hyphomonadaceae bacterium]